jgi:hypothetical protein
MVPAIKSLQFANVDLDPNAVEQMIHQAGS